MLILPAIDLRAGNCVRLYKGDYSRETIYHSDPGSVAKQFSDEGAGVIHVVDLDGAKAGEPVNMAAIRAIVEHASVPVELGGGIRTRDAVRTVLDLGVQRVILGTVLVKDPEFRRAMFGEFGEQIVAGVDARDGMVAVSGWEEGSSQDALELIETMGREGCCRFIVTDIATDGTLEGPNDRLMQAAAVSAERYGGVVIASGGVSSLDDLVRLSNIKPMLEGAITGKAIYEGRFSVAEAVEVVRPIGPD